MAFAPPALLRATSVETPSHSTSFLSKPSAMITSYVMPVSVGTSGMLPIAEDISRPALLTRQVSTPARLLAVDNDSRSTGTSGVMGGLPKSDSNWRANLAIEERQAMRERLKSAYQKTCPDFDSLLQVVCSLEEELVSLCALNYAEYSRNASEYSSKVELRFKQLKGLKSIYDNLALSGGESTTSVSASSPIHNQNIPSPNFSSPFFLPHMQYQQQGAARIVPARYGPGNNGPAVSAFTSTVLKGQRNPFLPPPHPSILLASMAELAKPVQYTRSLSMPGSSSSASVQSAVGASDERKEGGGTPSSLKRKESSSPDDDPNVRRSRRVNAGVNIRREEKEEKEKDRRPPSSGANAKKRRVSDEEKDREEKERRSREKLDWFVQIALGEQT
eukprot:GILJ01001459.1.p2 GENE.GILJ01001459.1~~GILJ01001459.1.p2  ORF type:complete len:389 (-),score=54.20 GILJ01001459.1:2207-3373(-)